MELKKAVELQTQYNGVAGIVRVDKDGFISINDMNTFFPSKRIHKWIKSEATKELVSAVEEKYELPPNGGIKTKRGRNGGTFAHHIIALDFAAWLSVEFRLEIYEAYINGTQKKQEWNIKRILAANNYKIMADAVNETHDPVKHYHYSNEAKMINMVVFGYHEKSLRDTATEAELNKISEMESHNATMIKLGMDYQERKTRLMQFMKREEITE